MVLFATALMEAPGAGGVVDAALEVSHVSHRPAWLTPLRVSPLGSVGGARCDHAGEVSVHDTIRYDTYGAGLQLPRAALEGSAAWSTVREHAAWVPTVGVEPCCGLSTAHSCCAPRP